MVLESNYPIKFREEDAKALGEFIKNRQPVAIIGMKRVGISNFLRFFLHQKDVIPTYIDSSNKHLFITVDLNDLVEREVFPFWVLTLKRIYDISAKLPLEEADKKHIESLFLSSIQTQELFLVIDSIRSALKILIDADYLPTLFYLRFDRIKDAITPEFFANLRGLKDSMINRLSFVFTSYRSFDFLSPDVFEKPTLTVFLRNMYIKPANNADMEIIYNSYKQKYTIDLSEDLQKNLLDLVNGYVRYLQLSLLVLQEKPKIQTAEDLFKLLTFDERLTLQSEELWESFTKEEKDLLVQVVTTGKYEKKDKDALEYLVSTGAVLENNKQFSIFSPIFTHFVKNRQQIGKTVIPVDFTKKEQLLFLILKKHEDAICDRETIIAAVWPEVEVLGVSDWAIDRLVARVRHKLKLQKAQYEIQTIKTRGYKLVIGN